MKIPFAKYHGTGNDFVLIDQFSKKHITEGEQALIRGICDRNFGIGADGLILLEPHDEFDFEMKYFNADGLPSSMCGNGGRCIVAFAKSLGIIGDQTRFLAPDGEHEAKISGNDVELKMGEVDQILSRDGHFVLNTGSPHFVSFVEDIDDIQVVENGQAIRYSAEFREEGINVNFVEEKGGKLIVFTYERGV
ncbi:MAG: diaminopimelate epimerase, partial [Saprospiraceae bacterium]|nr:diaminopimelate epimerase [Saprospiraceae bacterium]